MVRLALHTHAADRGEFETAISPLLEPGFRLAVSLSGDRAEAEDVLQEATLRAWRGWGQVRDRSALRAWYLRIVANQCRTARRRRWASVLRLERPPIGSTMADPEELADLRAALSRLAPGERAVLVLHYLLDMPLVEVAAVLGLRPAGAKSRLYRGLEKLRKEMA
ncbi:MAG TPA: RNA polymerase sigma factor [Candidatus Dormibacteraeota bacterium]